MQEFLHALDPLNAVLARALLVEHEAATAILAGGRTAAKVRDLVEQAFESTRTIPAPDPPTFGLTTTGSRSLSSAASAWIGWFTTTLRG